MTQHKEEHAALIQKESENKRKSAPASLSTKGTNDKNDIDLNKKEDAKNNGKQSNNNSTSGEVKATCPQCNQTFRRKFNLTIHIDRVSKHHFSFFFHFENNVKELIFYLLSNLVFFNFRFIIKSKISNAKFVKNRLRRTPI